MEDGDGSSPPVRSFEVDLKKLASGSKPPRFSNDWHLPRVCPSRVCSLPGYSFPMGRCVSSVSSPAGHLLSALPAPLEFKSGKMLPPTKTLELRSRSAQSANGDAPSDVKGLAFRHCQQMPSCLRIFSLSSKGSRIMGLLSAPALSPASLIHAFAIMSIHSSRLLAQSRTVYHAKARPRPEPRMNVGH